ncbi:MAG: hypothetical protein A2293_04080 [Elusimicrobia bacterium RIFOXYB2_FULL_49_7]|nr:MAG: hypothetical protein A2293_04080 [Elusimicrobia bacterium RIFOXYB2_FULL_49_7]
MEQKNRKQYDRDFRLQAVQLAESAGKTDRDVEKNLGLYIGAIRRWRREFSADPDAAFPGIGCLKPADEEVRRLRLENDVLRQERDILKKAMAIFSCPRGGLSRLKIFISFVLLTAGFIRFSLV